MSIFVGGCIALILGILGIIFWWWHFVAILQGVIPIMLVFAGALAVYLSIDQFKAYLNRNKKQESTSTGDTSHAKVVSEDVEDLRKENEELKRKLAENAVGGAKEKVEEAVEEVGDAVKGAAAKAKDTVADVAMKAKDTVVHTASDIKDAVVDAAGEVKDAVADAAGDVKDAVTEAKDAVKGKK